MRQLTIEFPLEVLSEAGLPLLLLREARFLTFLRQDLYGFQMSCKVQMVQVAAFKEKFEQYEAVRGVERLYRVNKDGLETLLIRGRWLNKESRTRDQAAKILRALSNCQRYLLRSPEVVGGKLRVAIGGEQFRISQLLAKFDKLKVPHRIAKFADRAPKADFALHLAT